MNKNLMPEVAELLGVKLEESFAIKTEKSIFRARITTSGLHINYDSIIKPDRNYCCADFFRAFTQSKGHRGSRNTAKNIGQ